MAVARVVVADDDVLLREGIARILLAGAGYDVVGQAGDATSSWELVASTRHPISSWPTSACRRRSTSEGLDAARAIRAELPEIGILLLSAHVELETAVDLLETASASATCSRAGCWTPATSSTRCERIAGGGSVIDPALVQELVRSGGATIRLRS